jgi:hypothetical protein
MRCGDTLLIPAPGSGVTPHLWIIVTEPAPDSHRCVIVSVTTLRYNKDQTVTLGPGDHPFVRHPSVVFYADAQIVDVRQLRADVIARVAEAREACSSDLLKLVQAGVSASPFTPKKVLTFCRQCWAR